MLRYNKWAACKRLFFAEVFENKGVHPVTVVPQLHESLLNQKHSFAHNYYTTSRL
jgi:hypothetical protein